MNKLTTRIATVAAALGLIASAAPAMALDTGDLIVRAGIGYVSPNDDTSNPNIPGLTVGSDASLALTIAYMVTPNIGVELVDALPFSHDIELNGSKIGETDHLPPTLLAQYYFDTGSAVTPYVGAGINYTAFFNTKSSLGDLDLDNSWGLAGEVGMDVDVGNNWLVNAAVWYMDIDTEAKLDGAHLTDVQIDPWVVFVGAGYTF